MKKKKLKTFKDKNLFAEK